ncbi:MAG TPA: bifunctional 5,10-methylenetetrahydrofolate dehydrogenase/5,10-methenyltetrahydrofolate cyclohydrolase [Bryobacteraceae bacterium]|nr:bifunctional 5,10-methylenetetrahydrofolate dehydrogenase/5,10-methenyltetrahydrofolate cyclohydrolase [Bryobacteraceae bacterium]
MMILDGTAVRAEILSRLKPRIGKLRRPPGLAVVLVGHDPASEIYVRGKIKASAELAIYSEKITPPETISTEDLLAIVEDLNRRPEIDAILVQMPLPRQIDSRRILESVAADKDADGFHPLNVGHLVAGRPAPRPCTPAGIVEMLKYYHVPMDGRRAVIVGRSDIVGKPMAMMLLHENATVTMCHSRTWNLPEECYRADILVAALGRPAFITGEFIAPGATVIDVGQSRIVDRALAARIGKAEEFERKGSVLVGDVHPVEVAQRASAYTPVPGGVGPLTIAMLMSNTVDLAERHQ